MQPMRAGQRPVRASTGRAIGPWGTVSRLLVGGAMAGSVFHGHTLGGSFHVNAWLTGLVLLPGVFLAWHASRARNSAQRFVAVSGAAGHALTFTIFFALYYTGRFVPAVAFLSDATLLFFGSSMVLAAVRGYAGCEVLAVSNVLMRRDDQLGCLIFDPIDQLERRGPVH